MNGINIRKLWNWLGSGVVKCHNRRGRDWERERAHAHVTHAKNMMATNNDDGHTEHVRINNGFFVALRYHSYIFLHTHTHTHSYIYFSFFFSTAFPLEQRTWSMLVYRIYLSLSLARLLSHCAAHWLLGSMSINNMWTVCVDFHADV